MKFSEQWLRALVNPDISTGIMLDQLTMAGLEVDGTEPAAGMFTDVVVAKVESVEKHPDADKLNVCQVTDGETISQIVCGASNVRAGLLTPMAKVGAVLPGDFKIKKAKLRGVESNGMLCSEKELGLAESAEGIMELADDAPVGQLIKDYMQLDDTVIEIDLTPNRGDCLSLTGIARELATLNQCDVTPVKCEAQTVSIDDMFPVEIAADEACTHYVGRVIKGINSKAITPLWMVERLRRSGIRSIDPVVDITNYVMLELGQPMHAFDLASLDGGIVVKFANNGDKITLLDGKVVELDAKSLLISDHKRALALAGIMGGENSGISENTVDIFLESAYFEPVVIAGKARSYGLHTDSSHRFERGVDPLLQSSAIERATELILDICGGQSGPVTDVTTSSHSKQRETIQLRPERISRVLGIELSSDAIEDILLRLGMSVEKNDQGWLVQAPSFRFDVSIEADLLEELVRIYGYNNIPKTRANYQGGMQAQTETKSSLDKLKQVLVNRGYFEAITYSFVDPKCQQILDPQAQTIALANPISSEMSVMRTTIWPGLIQALQYNLNRQHSRVRLFETGLCFKPDGESINQINMISGAICGDFQFEQWGDKSRKVDFFDLKNDVESLLEFSGMPCVFEATEHPALHPGQSAKITQNGKSIGWIGALHPQVNKSLDIDQSVYVFELEMDSILDAKIPAFSSLSKYPEVRRDLAIVVDEEISIQAIKECVTGAASELLEQFQIFDVYTGKGVDKGRKSIAFGLILQGFSRTLTDQDVDDEIEKVVTALKLNFTATLRE